jgi:hypothetical protein
MTLPAVDRVAITTVVDNYIDSLRRDEKVARRFGHAQARKMPDLRAEHGLHGWAPSCGRYGACSSAGAHSSV